VEKSFPVLTCPKEIRDVADVFKDCVGGYYKAWVVVLCASVFGVSGISVIFRFFMFSPSVSTVSRFYNDKNIFEKLNRRHRRRIKRMLEKTKSESKRYMWAIDDTLLQHYGKDIWGCYYWHDHTNGGTIIGHKLLVLGLVDRKKNLLIPVYWTILHQDKKDGHYKKGWEVALDLLDSAIAFGFPTLTVCTDSWFAGDEFFTAIIKRKINFVIEIKNNRKVAGYRRNELLNESIEDFFSCRSRKKIFRKEKHKWASEAIVRFKDSKHKLKVVAVANKKGLVNKPFAYYVSNQLTWNASMIWSISRDRWTIEVQFRELKNNFTLGETAVQSKQSVETTISVSVIALTAIRLKQIMLADANKNQKARPLPAGIIVNDFQLKSINDSITKLAFSSDEKIKLRLKSRLDIGNFGRKPTEKYKELPNATNQLSMRKIS
jgi:hypothetical protein